MVICKLDPNQLGLLPNQIVTHIDWQISSDSTFNTVEHEQLNDNSVDENGDKIFQFNWNRLNLDAAKTWYGRARVLVKDTDKNTELGWSTFGNLDVFNIVDNSITDATIGELPTRVAPPVVSTNSTLNNHRQTMFTIYAKGYEVIGSAAHMSTSWIIEDINSNVVWSRLRDDMNKDSIIIDNFILKSNTAYRLKAIFHSSANASSQVGCCTIKTSNGNNIRLLNWIDTYDIKEDLKIDITIPSNLKYDSLTYRILGDVDNVIEEIHSVNTTDTSVTFNKDLFKFNNTYVLEIVPIRNNREIGTTLINFKTITPSIADLYNGDIKYDNYREWLYENNMSEPVDEVLPKNEYDLEIDLKDPNGTSDTDNYYHELTDPELECSGKLSSDFIILKTSGYNSIEVITDDTVNCTAEAGGRSGNRSQYNKIITHSAYSNAKVLGRYEIKLTNPRKRSKYLYYYLYNNYDAYNANLGKVVEFELPEVLDVGTEQIEFTPTTNNPDTAPTQYQIFTLPYIHTNPAQTNPYGYPYAIISSYETVSNNSGNLTDKIKLQGLKTGTVDLYVIGERAGFESVIKKMKVRVDVRNYITTTFNIIGSTTASFPPNSALVIDYEIEDGADIVVEKPAGIMMDNINNNGGLSCLYNSEMKKLFIRSGSTTGRMRYEVIGRKSDSTLGYKDKKIVLDLTVDPNVGYEPGRILRFQDHYWSTLGCNGDCYRTNYDGHADYYHNWKTGEYFFNPVYDNTHYRIFYEWSYVEKCWKIRNPVALGKVLSNVPTT